MITITVETGAAIASENGTELKRWNAKSRPAMLAFIKKTGVEKFDLTTCDLAKSLLKSLTKATDPTPKAEPVQAERPDIAPAEPFPIPVPTTVATKVDGDTVEQTFVVDDGSSVTVVHPAR